MAPISSIRAPLDVFCTYFQNIKIPAHERIQALFRRIASLTKETQHEINPLFEKCLNFVPQEEKKMHSFSHLIHQLKDPNIQILPTEIPGMYRIELKGKTLAFFKAGPMRAEVEGCVATLAQLTGLGDYVVRGIPCVLCNVEILKSSDDNASMNPSPTKDVDVIESSDDDVALMPSPTEDLNLVLWNDFVAKVLPGTIPALIGILEPAIDIPDEIEFTPIDLVKLSIICLIARLRDIKSDGIGYQAGCPVLFDVEDAFAVADPRTPLEELPSRMDFSFLDSDKEIAQTPISLEEFKKLQILVKSWDCEKIFQILKDRQILLADHQLEKLPLGAQSVDTAGCAVVIQKQGAHKMHPTKRSVPFQPPHRFFTYRQRKAINADLIRMKHLIEKWEGPLSAEALVLAFDKRHKKLVEIVGHSPAAGRILGGLNQTLANFSAAVLHRNGLISDGDLGELTPSPHRPLASGKDTFSFSPKEGLKSPPPSRAECSTPSPLPHPKNMTSPAGVHRPTPIHSSPQRSGRASQSVDPDD